MNAVWNDTWITDLCDHFDFWFRYNTYFPQIQSTGIEKKSLDKTSQCRCVFACLIDLNYLYFGAICFLG